MASALVVATIVPACSAGGGTVHITVSCHGAANCATAQYEQLTAQCSDTSIHRVVIKLNDSGAGSGAHGVERTLPCPGR